MPKFSSLFKRHKDVNLKGSSDDASPHGQEGLSDSTRPDQSPPRLARSPIIRGLQHPDDVDLSGIPLTGVDQTFVLAPGSCSPSPSNRLSRYLSKFKMLSPLPSPPRSSVQGSIQSSRPWPLPSPRQSPRGNEGNERFLSDLSLENVWNGHEMLPSAKNTGLLEGEPYMSTIDTEDLQRLPSDLPTQSFAKFDQTWPGSSVEAAASSTQGLQFRYAKGEGGGDLHIYIHVNHAQHSTPSSRFSSPLPCPQELGTQKDPWLWNSASGHPRQLAGGLNLMTNDSSPEFSTRVLRRAEYPHDDGVDYALSRDSRHPLPYPQTIGTPTGLPSPPRSPRAASPGSPRRAESEPSAGKWQKGHLLGSGAFGKVYKGIHMKQGNFVP